MSLKVKLISCLSAFIIVASLMLISVFAATNVTLNIGGNVSFTASSVNAYITGSIAGNAAGGSTLTPIDIDASDSDGAVSMPSDWTAMDLTFTESASPITVTINIQNRSTDRDISVSLTDNTNISNVTVARKAGDTTLSQISDTRTITGGTTLTYTFTLTVNSNNNSTSGDFGLSVALESVIIPTYTATLNWNVVFGLGAEQDGSGGGCWYEYSLNNGSDWELVDFEGSTSGSLVLRNITQIRFRIARAGGDWDISLLVDSSEVLTMNFGYGDAYGEGNYLTSSNYVLDDDMTVLFVGDYSD